MRVAMSDQHRPTVFSRNSAREQITSVNKETPTVTAPGPKPVLRFFFPGFASVKD